MKYRLTTLLACLCCIPFSTASAAAQQDTNQIKTIINLVNKVGFDAPLSVWKQNFKNIGCRFVKYNYSGSFFDKTEPNAWTFTDKNNNKCKGIQNAVYISNNLVDNFVIREIPLEKSKTVLDNPQQQLESKLQALFPRFTKISGGHSIFSNENLEAELTKDFTDFNLIIRKNDNQSLNTTSSPRDILDYFVNHIKPGQDNLQSLESVAKDLNCRLIDNTDLDNKSSTDIHYRLLSNKNNGDCLGLYNGIITKSSGTLKEFYFVPNSAADIVSYRDALKELASLHINTKTDDLETHDVYRTPNSAVYFDSWAFDREGSVKFVPLSHFSYEFTQEEQRQKELKEAEERKLAAEKALNEARTKAGSYTGKVFGVFTPGETTKAMLLAKLEQQGCVLNNYDYAVKANDYRGTPCFSLPGNASIQFHFTDGITEGMTINVETPNAKDIDSFEDKFNKQFGKYNKLNPKDFDLEERETSFFESLFEEKTTVRYWSDNSMAILMIGLRDMPDMKNMNVKTLGIITFMSKSQMNDILARIENTKNKKQERVHEKKQGLDSMF